MEVITAKTAGFCFGVKRAVDTVYEQVEKNEGPVYSYGPIIHNDEVVRDLEEKGLRVINGEEEISTLEKGTVIIRSHGVGEKIYRLFDENGMRVVDATCPFVKKIHRIVHERKAAGDTIVIVGNRTHPEVQGILGWCEEEAFVIETEEEAKMLEIEAGQEITIVAQTTTNAKKFENIVEILRHKDYNSVVMNTICNATEERQREASEISARADLMIVIGGKHSSNTQKLFDICNINCANTYYIQTLNDLERYSLPPVDCVGITAGASTPIHIIKEVQKYVRDEL